MLAPHPRLQNARREGPTGPWAQWLPVEQPWRGVSSGAVSSPVTAVFVSYSLLTSFHVPQTGRTDPYRFRHQLAPSLPVAVLGRGQSIFLPRAVTMDGCHIPSRYGHISKPILNPSRTVSCRNCPWLAILQRPTAPQVRVTPTWQH